MNWLDIILIIVILITFIAGIGLFTIGIKEEEIGTAIGILITAIVACLFIGGLAFFKLDKRSGNTIGTIVSVDKNFFGTTAVYIKVTENNQEEYCVENDKIANIAAENIGNKVKISYGKRVGLYSTGACEDAPIDDIELLEE